MYHSKRKEIGTIKAFKKKEFINAEIITFDPWFVLYKLSKPFFFTTFQLELAAL